jgi:hypothetical protein
MKQGVDTKATRRKTLEMDEESFSIKMEATMMENGKITRCTGGASYSTREEN